MRKRWLRLQRYMDEHTFKKHQADYFLYLSQLLQGTQGQYTMSSVFAADAMRYGTKHYRGRLSAYWLQRYQHNGGHLAQTWQGILSAEVWLLLDTAQGQGDQALLTALDVVTQQLQEQNQLKGQLIQLFWPVGFALILLGSMLLLMPWFTVPQLQNTFHAVPEEYYGVFTRWLFSWSELSRRYGVVLLLSITVLMFTVVLSLSSYQGRWRRFLDRLEPWQSYKSLQGLRFLGLLSLLLNNSSRQLRLAYALQLMQRSPNKWLRHYLQRIQYRIAQGDTGAESFDVGLFSQDTLWFLTDMEKSQGLAKALSLSAQRLHSVVRRRIPLKAQVLRWLMLLGCVGALLLIGGWHYVVIDELRNALLMLYANQ